MRKVQLRSATILCALALLACSADKGRARESAGAPEGGAPTQAAAPRSVPPEGAAREDAGAKAATPFRVATYNGGLAMGVLKYVDERAEPLIRALAEQPVDLLCVQEFWLEEHWQKLVAATSSTLPSTFRLPPGHEDGGCSKQETDPLVACAAQRCAGLTQHALLPCLLQSCSTRLTSLSPDCFNCLSASPRKGPDELAQACLRTQPKGAAGARPPARAGGATAPRAYSGASGAAILTDAEILERDALVLPSAIDRRAVLYARLSPPSIGELHVFCTHLTAGMEGVPHPRNTSWQKDQSAQIDALLAYVDKKTGGRGATLLLGDLNTGPAIAPSISARLPAHYDRLLARGFVNPYASQEDARCTYCFDNPLDGGKGTRGILIDHVLLRGFDGDATGTQIMRSNLTIEAGKRKVKSGFSDHYGLLVTLSRRAS
ncbi:endonuclease/exonuclease/phosphatase family protein [Sorangium sp. So ce854]|uniref:endonuclease/exonuclease/phosphatase family protein n=1 Tax=Sorangium sp. So ce854 TaxID=3133322 RepID=UPI003F60EB8A